MNFHQKLQILLKMLQNGYKLTLSVLNILFSKLVKKYKAKHILVINSLGTTLFSAKFDFLYLVSLSSKFLLYAVR